MVRVDFHTHSIASHDGGISPDSYKKCLSNGLLDVIAITDHNRIDIALQLQKELGTEKIIVGEEISTLQGDIIGLYLTEPIAAGLELDQAVSAIKDQGGLVYIPHPFETVRKGLSKENMEKIADDIAIVESANGRAYFQNFGPQAHGWARLNQKAVAGSSDAHRYRGLGRTYTLLSETPKKDSLLSLLSHSRIIYKRPSGGDLLAPKYNKLRKIRGKS